MHPSAGLYQDPAKCYTIADSKETDILDTREKNKIC